MRAVDDPSSYAPTPSSFWRPSWETLERRIPYTGPAALFYRIFRLTWVLFTAPIWVIMVYVSSFFPEQYRPGCRPSWPLKQRICIPLLGRVVWAITFGIPPRFYEDHVPSTRQKGYTITPDTAPVAPSAWYDGSATDPENIIVPLAVKVYWVEPELKACVAPASENSTDAVMVVSGGGYVQGHPLDGSRCYEITTLTGIKALAFNYRKAMHVSRAFPAALQDIITAYHYVLSRGFTRVAIIGDSSGGGLVLALLQHLSTLTSNADLSTPLLPPSRVVLYSPWVDLTLSHPSIKDNVHLDLVHPTMLCTAGWGYLAAVRRHAARSDIQIVKGSVYQLGLQHPLFSPSLPYAMESLKKLAAWSKPKIFVIWGSAEMLDDEIVKLCDNLREAGFGDRIREHRWEDEVHIFPILPAMFSMRKREALVEVADFLLEGLETVKSANSADK